MAVRQGQGQATQLATHTTRSPKHGEIASAGYIRLPLCQCDWPQWCPLGGTPFAGPSEGDPDTAMRDAEASGLESDKRPLDSDTYVGNLLDDSSRLGP
jgi:hypothetical protein